MASFTTTWAQRQDLPATNPTRRLQRRTPPGVATSGPRAPAAADICPTTGWGQLSYPRAEYLFESVPPTSTRTAKAGLCTNSVIRRSNIWPRPDAPHLSCRPKAATGIWPASAVRVPGAVRAAEHVEQLVQQGPHLLRRLAVPIEPVVDQRDERPPLREQAQLRRPGLRGQPSGHAPLPHPGQSPHLLLAGDQVVSRRPGTGLEFGKAPVRIAYGKNLTTVSNHRWQDTKTEQSVGALDGCLGCAGLVGGSQDWKAGSRARTETGLLKCTLS